MEKISLRRQSVYCLLVGLAGLVVALYNFPRFQGSNWIVFLFLVILSVMLESLPIPLRGILASLIPLVPISALVVYGPAMAIWTVVIASFLVPIISRDWNWFTAVFNIGQYALSVFAMSYVYRFFHMMSGSLFDTELVVSVIVASLTFLFVNHLLINVLQWIRGNFYPSFMVNILLTDMANIALCLPFAFLMIAVSPDHALIGPIVILPVVILAYILRVHRQTRDLQYIHQATTQLASEFDIHEIALQTAQIAKKVTMADFVTVFFLDREANALMPTAIYPPSFAEEFANEGIPEESGGVIWRTIHERGVVYIPDTRRDKRVKFYGPVPAYLSMAIFPMHAHMEVQGVIVCYGRHPHAFNYTTPYLEALANQASVLFENARLYQELQERTRRDGATGLYNYRYFYEQLSMRVTQASQTRTPISVMIVDVDFFKKFNDTYGHLAGDAVLREVGQLLASKCTDGAFAARYGGEEFALLLPVSETKAFEVAEDIREAVRSLTVDFHGYKLQGITVSIGIASCPMHSQSDRDLLLKADSAMYWGAKQRGRNKSAMYTPEFDAQLFVDSLTGLYTFHFMNICVRDEIAKGRAGWGVICLDLHHFGRINGTFGFDVGDFVLQQVGMLVRECLRHAELACRYGGDELLILLPGVAESEVLGVSDRVTRAIATHRFEVRDNVVLSMRVNSVSRVLQDVEDPADLFNRVSELFATLERESEEFMA